MKIEIQGNVDDVEKEIVKKNLGRVEINLDEEELIENLIESLNKVKEEGERVNDFEDRIWGGVKKILKLDDN